MIAVASWSFLPTLSATGSAAAASATQQASPATTQHTSVPSYWVATNAGNVFNFGGLPFYGSLRSDGIAASTPVVGIASTPDGLGYWLATSSGAVYNFGDARFYGSMAGRPMPSGRVVAIAADPQTGGYWLATGGGQVYGFGAPFLGSLVEKGIQPLAPITAMTATTSGTGYWLLDTAGNVYSFAGASNYGSSAGDPSPPFTGMLSTPDSKGYWIAAAAGSVYTLGDAVFYGAAYGTSTSPVTAIAGTPDGKGYWLAMADGSIINFGDAQYGGSASTYLQEYDSTYPGAAVVGIAEGPGTGQTPSSLTYPSGSFGYDISWPQCGSALPAKPYTIAIIGVTGGSADNDNSCLASEAAWAGYAHEDYINVNIPSTADEMGDYNGPFGSCPTPSSGNGNWYCQAGNYGYAAAHEAMSYASSQNASAPVWWLDVEEVGSCTNSFPSGGSGYWSCNNSINAYVIRGMLEAFKTAGVTPGIYSTYLQWPAITTGPLGAYNPGGPLWVPGAYDSSWRDHCGGSYTFAGGNPVLVQGGAGYNNTAYDEDFAC